MKALKIIASVLALGLSFTATANAQRTMDAYQAAQAANKVRQVTYSCTTGGTVQVNYGFNNQELPTYAEANLGGKTRFLPINLARSDISGTTFGDDNGWQISGTALQLNNYHRSDVLIHDPAAQTAYKGCYVVGTKRIKG